MIYDLSWTLTELSARRITREDSWQMLRCSQRDFAQLIGVSIGYVNRLVAQGLLVTNPQGHVKVLESFRRFWKWYLPPWRQQELIQQATDDIEDFDIRRKSSNLFAVRALHEKILEAETLRLRAEITLRFVDGLPTKLMAAFDEISAMIRKLRRQQQRARQKLVTILTAVSLPPKVLVVLKRRFVNCLSVEEIAAELNLSTRQIFRLQRHGLELLAGNNK